MRKLWAAGIAVALAVLWLAPPGVSGAAASESDHARLERYAATTWASFVAMVDTPSGLPTDQLHADGQHRRADVDDEHRRLHVERGRRRAARHHRPRRAGHPAHGDARDAGADGAPPARRPVLQLVRPPRRREAHDLAADRRPAGPDPVLGRQRAGSRPGCGSCATPCRSCRPQRRRDLRLDGLRLLLRARTRTGSCSTTRPAQGTGPCCYDTVVSESRIADYIGIAKGELPRKEYYGRWRTFPDTCDCSWQETQPERVHPHLRRRLASTTAATRTAAPG